MDIVIKLVIITFAIFGLWFFDRMIFGERDLNASEDELD